MFFRLFSKGLCYCTNSSTILLHTSYYNLCKNFFIFVLKFTCQQLESTRRHSDSYIMIARAAYLSSLLGYSRYTNKNIPVLATRGRGRIKKKKMERISIYFSIQYLFIYLFKAYKLIFLRFEDF